MWAEWMELAGRRNRRNLKKGVGLDVVRRNDDERCHG